MRLERTSYSPASAPKNEDRAADAPAVADNETAPDDNSPPEYKHNLHGTQSASLPREMDSRTDRRRRRKDLAPFLEAENHLVELLQSFRSYLQEHHPVESAVLGPDGRPTALNLPRDLPTVAVQVKVGDGKTF